MTDHYSDQTDNVTDLHSDQTDNVTDQYIERPDDMTALQGGQKDRITELHCNLDDMTGEEIGFALERLYEAGAVEAFTIPVMTKKNRPAWLLTALVKEEKAEAVIGALFRYTTTLGVRRVITERSILRRREMCAELPEGTVRVKISEGYGVCRRKMEYEDLRAIAVKTGKSLEDVREMVRQHI